ncbi:hypothetical protein PoB_002669800 [Plakobranchus ocellatus]|uniref:Uncharacterized protein n=1 Tax=Plakobranchus ocellatus TaxID=259542 RepID=A0AAV4A0K1_9GAST|nr:hypothetical protein PoB_002669800 [Plakobranchus ocellatus]
MTATVVSLLTVCCAFVSAAYRQSSEGGPPEAPYKLRYADYKKTWENYKNGRNLSNLHCAFHSEIGIDSSKPFSVEILQKSGSFTET